MTGKFQHFMDESDIGSGEKTPAEMDDLAQTARLKEDQERNRQAAAPQDGSHLLQVVEEQEYLNDHENHLPGSQTDDTLATHEARPEHAEDAPQHRDARLEPARHAPASTQRQHQQ